MKLCDYGCGNEGLYPISHGKVCCSKRWNLCPRIISKITEKVLCDKCLKYFSKNTLNIHKKVCGKYKCEHCLKTLNSKRRFCNSTCFSLSSAKSKKYSKPKVKRYCKNCNNEITGKSYCSNTCQSEFEYKLNVELWLKGKLNGTCTNGHKGYIKKYLMDLYANKCSNCGWGETHSITNKVPLHVHHIDGDWENNSPSNVTLLCPNCHSLTENYGSLNIGKKEKIRPSLIVRSKPVQYQIKDI